MGIFESSTISLVSLEPTTSTLTSNVITTSTTIGATTTIGGLSTLERDKDGNHQVNPKKLALVLGTSIGTSALSSVNLHTPLAEEYKEQAAQMGITVDQENAINEARNVEEWFESLSDEQQIEFLASLDQKEQELQCREAEPKIIKKHL